MGGEIFHPGGVALGLDVDAVRLRVLGFQVAIVIGKGFPQVQKSAVLFQRNGSQLIVDLAQPLFVQAGMAAAHLGPDRRDGLHVDLRVGQGLGDHIQHEPVVGEKAGIIPVPVEHVGAQQDIQHRGLLGCQHFHGDLGAAIGALAGGAIDHNAGVCAPVGAERGFRQAAGIDLHPLRQAVTQKTDVGKITAVHGGGAVQRGQPEIHGGGPGRGGLHGQPPRGRVADGVPLAALQLLLEDGRALHGGRALLPVEALPQQAYGAEQDEQHQQPGNGKIPAPALAQDAAAVFLIIGHKNTRLSLCLLLSLYSTRRGRASGPCYFTAADALWYNEHRNGGKP